MTATEESRTDRGGYLARCPGRWEWYPIAAVWRREAALFRRSWGVTTFSSLVEPAVYLLAFGFGFGSLVAYADGHRYLDFVGTGIVGTAAIFTSAYPAMFHTFIKRDHICTYDAVLAAPVDVHELVLAEASWIAAKSAVYSAAPLLVMMGFGLRPAIAALCVPLIVFVTAACFALFGIWLSTLVPSMSHYDYIISAVLTPIFLVAGSFFPLAGLPAWMHALAELNPLYHCVVLVREAVFSSVDVRTAGHVAVLFVFGGLMWLLAVRGMRRRLVK